LTCEVRAERATKQSTVGHRTYRRMTSRRSPSHEVSAPGRDTTDALPELSNRLAWPLTDGLEMAQAREEFANSITDSNPLEPPPSNDYSALVPDP
jgi:hypothetical protein